MRYVRRIARPTAVQPGGWATSAMASGTIISAAPTICFTLLRPRMRRETGANSAFIDSSWGFPLENLHLLVGSLSLGRLVGPGAAYHVQLQRFGVGAFRPGLRLERALRIRAHGAIEVALQQRLRLVREQRQRRGGRAQRGLVQALELLARDVLELHRDAHLVVVLLDLARHVVHPLHL